MNMINIFKFLFKKDDINYNSYNSYKFERDIDIDINRNIMLQKFENDKIERGIRIEAQRWLEEDTKSKNCIHIMSPFIHSINIYHEETAKYKNCNIRKLIYEEYNNLKSNQDD